MTCQVTPRTGTCKVKLYLNSPHTFRQDVYLTLLPPGREIWISAWKYFCQRVNSGKLAQSVSWKEKEILFFFSLQLCWVSTESTVREHNEWVPSGKTHRLQTEKTDHFKSICIQFKDLICCNRFFFLSFLSPVVSLWSAAYILEYFPRLRQPVSQQRGMEVCVLANHTLVVSSYLER